jgi:hypothetical protein
MDFLLSAVVQGVHWLLLPLHPEKKERKNVEKFVDTLFKLKVQFTAPGKTVKLRDFYFIKLQITILL